MSRQIKFRAWDAEQNKMIEAFDGEYQIRVNEEDGTLYCGGYMPNGDWNEPPLMQFTGLLDRNGNEIFEGDILKWKCSKSGCKKEQMYVVTIEWKNGSHGYSLTIHDNGEKWATQKSYWNASEREIVGNVYENHDVLSA